MNNSKKNEVRAWSRGAVVGLLLMAMAGVCSAGTLNGRVVGVADGDTVTVLDKYNTQHKVRLAGIDAPERAQAFGQRAKQAMSDLVSGKTVVVITGKVDRYGRSVGKVLVDDDDANLKMITAGLAWHYKAYQDEQPLVDRVSYAAAEVLARAKGVGLWRDAAPVAPWEWRAANRKPAAKLQVNNY